MAQARKIYYNPSGTYVVMTIDHEAQVSDEFPGRDHPASTAYFEMGGPVTRVSFGMVGGQEVVTLRSNVKEIRYTLGTSTVL